MDLHSLKAPKNSRHAKKRVGRGQGSGWGKTAGRGGKGQKARSGNMHFEGFEGGQSPLQRRLPKRGFVNPFSVDYAILNVGDLEAFFESGSAIDEAALRERGLVKGKIDGIKILGDGELSKKLSVKAHKFSAKAKALIEKAGGTAEVIVVPKKAPPKRGVKKAAKAAQA